MNIVANTTIAAKVIKNIPVEGLIVFENATDASKAKDILRISAKSTGGSNHSSFFSFYSLSYRDLIKELSQDIITFCGKDPRIGFPNSMNEYIHIISAANLAKDILDDITSNDEGRLHECNEHLFVVLSPMDYALVHETAMKSKPQVISQTFTGSLKKKKLEELFKANVIKSPVDNVNENQVFITVGEEFEENESQQDYMDSVSYHYILRSRWNDKVAQSLLDEDQKKGIHGLYTHYVVIVNDKDFYSVAKKNK